MCVCVFMCVYMFLADTLLKGNSFVLIKILDVIQLAYKVNMYL